MLDNVIGFIRYKIVFQSHPGDIDYKHLKLPWLRFSFTQEWVGPRSHPMLRVAGTWSYAWDSWGKQDGARSFPWHPLLNKAAK
jgi:hypothetical protein